jgi:hypothetical protein
MRRWQHNMKLDLENIMADEATFIWRIVLAVAGC